MLKVFFLLLSGVPCFTAFLPHVDSVVKISSLLPFKEESHISKLFFFFFSFSFYQDIFQRFYLTLPESLLRSQLTVKK